LSRDNHEELTEEKLSRARKTGEEQNRFKGKKTKRPGKNQQRERKAQE
jgi:hypothetical protein